MYMQFQTKTTKYCFKLKIAVKNALITHMKEVAEKLRRYFLV